MRYDCGSTAPILEYTVVGKKKQGWKWTKPEFSLWKILPSLTAHISKKFQGFFNFENLWNLPGITKKKHEAERNLQTINKILLNRFKD